jgi:hypothetical protein
MKKLCRSKYRPLNGFSVFSGGLLSILVQATVLRESLFGCHQAELASGTVLAAWIVGSGLGAAAGGRAVRHRFYWVAGMMALPFLGFLQIAASRTGTLPLALSILPAGFVAGIIFIQPFAFSRPGRIYALEALGAAAGGGIFVLLSPSLLAGEILAVSLVFSIVGILSCRSILPGFILLAGLILMLAFSLPANLSRELTSLSYGEYDDFEVYPSPYGEVVSVTRAGQSAVFRGGLLEATWPSIESAEQTTFVPLAAALPLSVLYIGSSPEEAEAAFSWPTVEYCVSVVPERILSRVISYPGITVYGDGRRYLEECESSFDLILVSTGQPLTLLSNRFYTAQFMELLSERLSPEGIAAVHLLGGINSLHPLEAELAISVKMASERSFTWTRILPVSGLLLLAGNGPEPSLGGVDLAGRLDSLGIAGAYVNSGTLPFDLSDFRVSAFDHQLESAEAAVNRDLHPEGFRIARELWDIRTGNGSGTDLTVPAACLFVLIMAGAALLTRKPLLSLGVSAAGFTGLSVEVITLVAVQAASGYSWVLVGAVTGIFMTGGALGACLADRGWIGKPLRIVLLSGASALFCAAALKLYSAGILSGFLLSGSLLAGTLACGIASGGAFTSAAGILGSGATGRIGLLNLAEHSGSAAASLLMPLVLFPVLGAAGALAVSAGWIAVWAVVLKCR